MAVRSTVYLSLQKQNPTLNVDPMRENLQHKEEEEEVWQCRVLRALTNAI